jgi:hypothetical protein
LDIRGHAARLSERRFPPPWSVEEQSACYLVRDHSGQALAQEPGGKQKQALIFTATQQTGAPNIQPEFIFERRKFSQ